MTTVSPERDVKMFKFSFPTCTVKEVKFELEIPIKFPYSGCTGELSHRISSMFHIPVFIQEDLEKALEDFVKKETREFYNSTDELLLSAAKSGDLNVEQIIKDWEKSYKEQTVEYADQKGAPDEEVFAAVYHKLVHSPALEAVLQVEGSYASCVRSITRQRDIDVKKMTISQTEEMDKKMRLLHTYTTEEEINDLAGKHFEEQSMVAGRWGSELDALKQAQRSEYRIWLMRTLDALETNAKLETPSNSPLSQYPILGVPEPVSNTSRTTSHGDRLLEESFTIHLGSQLKQMHNIRIMSADVMKFCKVKPSHDSVMDAPRRLQTALGLYSSDLCGLVMLVESPPPHYMGLAKRIGRACQQSTELHFSNMDRQLEKIIEDVKGPVERRNSQRMKNLGEYGHPDGMFYRKTKEVSKYLQTGDIYITKHSNLSEVHILFHLMADESSLKSGDINSRHPAILGLRNILKTACSNDVTTLTLPVLLRHDMSEEMTVAWCAKRAELVLKCVKGFMIEMASWGGSELKNIQFLVPEGISEEVFSTLAAMLPTIFRVSNPLKFKADSEK